jgi:hypothetical protein
MATLHIIWDPRSCLSVSSDAVRHANIKQARLDVADDLESRDIYELARKLAELLVGQLS